MQNGLREAKRLNLNPRPESDLMTRILSIPATRAVTAIALTALLAACGHQPDPALTGGVPNDPHEVSNRRMHETNKALDRNLVSPASKGYRALVPDDIETGIS